MSPDPADRRRATRHRLDAACHGVTARHAAAPNETTEGHVYDLSTSGARIELDDAVAEGSEFELALHLPGLAADVDVLARVVRVYDAEDDPGACRLAVAFTKYRSEADRRRLAGWFGPATLRRAA